MLALQKRPATQYPQSLEPLLVFSQYPPSVPDFLHDACPGEFWNHPLGQSLQSANDAPPVSSLYVPLPLPPVQRLHDVFPFSSWYRPTWHSGHSLQLLYPPDVLLYRPAEQADAGSAPPAHSAQLVSFVAPDVELALPTAHARHPDVEMPYHPVGQAWQSVPGLVLRDTLANCPDAQYSVQLPWPSLPWY